MSRKGHTVHVANDIATARRVVAEHEIDRIFLDVFLGNESGFEMQHRLEEHHVGLARRAIFVSGDARSDAALGESFERAGRPVLHMPFGLEELEAYL